MGTIGQVTFVFKENREWEEVCWAYTTALEIENIGTEFENAYTEFENVTEGDLNRAQRKEQKAKD